MVKKVKSLRVVRVISGLWPGGVEKKLTNLLPMLRDHGLDVSVLCLREEGELAPLLRDQGIDVQVIRLESRWSPSGLWKLRNYFREEKVDVVHTHMYRSNISGTVAARMAGVPVVISNIHNVDSWDNRRQILTDKLVSPFRHCTVCVSKGVAIDYRAKISVPDSRLRIIYNGVDVDHYFPGDVNCPDPVDQAGISIGSAARLMPQKGLDFLVQAAADPEFQANNVKFRIAGDGPLRDELETQAKDLGAESYFEILGFISDIRNFYRSIDILAMPSHREGFSNALVEAMACGVAPVATDVGGNAEAINDGVSGTIVPAHDYPAFRKALLALVKNKEQRMKMAQEARARAEKFSLGNMARQTVDMYLTFYSQKGK